MFRFLRDRSPAAYIAHACAKCRYIQGRDLRPIGCFIPAESLVLTGTARDNGTARGTLNQPVLGLLDETPVDGISRECDLSNASYMHAMRTAAARRYRRGRGEGAASLFMIILGYYRTKYRPVHPTRKPGTDCFLRSAGGVIITGGAILYLDFFRDKPPCHGPGFVRERVSFSSCTHFSMYY